MPELLTDARGRRFSAVTANIAPLFDEDGNALDVGVIAEDDIEQFIGDGWARLRGLVLAPPIPGAIYIARIKATPQNPLDTDSRSHCGKRSSDSVAPIASSEHEYQGDGASDDDVAGEVFGH